jgi:hypothetical protein
MAVNSKKEGQKTVNIHTEKKLHMKQLQQSVNMLTKEDG